MSLGSEETHAEHHHCPGRCVSPATARRLAAELLAAANACEILLPPETERVLRPRVTGGRIGSDQEPATGWPRAGRFTHDDPVGPDCFGGSDDPEAGL